MSASSTHREARVRAASQQGLHSDAHSRPLPTGDLLHVRPRSLSVDASFEAADESMSVDAAVESSRDDSFADTTGSNEDSFHQTSGPLREISADQTGASSCDSEFVKVAVRVRPVLPCDDRHGSATGRVTWKAMNRYALANCEMNDFSQPFKWEYDYVFCGAPGAQPNAGHNNTNRDLYNVVAKPVVERALRGMHGTVFAYGQSNSGKTHTMFGTGETPGIIPLAIGEVFHHISTHSASTEFLVRATLLEIYNEKVYDLLAPDAHKPSTGPKRRQSSVKIREKGGQVIVEGATDVELKSAADASHMLTVGYNNRSSASTALNDRSSRSHCIFQVTIESRPRKTDQMGEVAPKGEDNGADENNENLSGNSSGNASTRGVLFAQLNLVDLGGFERSGAMQMSGKRTREGSHINKSLLTLGKIIEKLSSIAPEESTDGMSPAMKRVRGSPDGGVSLHLPYRESKLTRILQNALGGNCFLSVICTVSPISEDAKASVSTLRFAQRVKRIQNKAVVNENCDLSVLLKRTQRDLAILKEKTANTQRKQRLRKQWLSYCGVLLDRARRLEMIDTIRLLMQHRSSSAPPKAYADVSLNTSLPLAAAPEHAPSEIKRSNSESDISTMSLSLSESINLSTSSIPRDQKKAAAGLAAFANTPVTPAQARLLQLGIITRTPESLLVSPYSEASSTALAESPAPGTVTASISSLGEYSGIRSSSVSGHVHSDVHVSSSTTVSREQRPQSLPKPTKHVQIAEHLDSDSCSKLSGSSSLSVPMPSRVTVCRVETAVGSSPPVDTGYLSTDPKGKCPLKPTTEPGVCDASEGVPDEVEKENKRLAAYVKVLEERLKAKEYDRLVVPGSALDVSTVSSIRGGHDLVQDLSQDITSLVEYVTECMSRNETATTDPQRTQEASETDQESPKGKLSKAKSVSPLSPAGSDGCTSNERVMVQMVDEVCPADSDQWENAAPADPKTKLLRKPRSNSGSPSPRVPRGRSKSASLVKKALDFHDRNNDDNGDVNRLELSKKELKRLHKLEEKQRKEFVAEKKRQWKKAMKDAKKRRKEDLKKQKQNEKLQKKLKKQRQKQNNGPNCSINASEESFLLDKSKDYGSFADPLKKPMPFPETEPEDKGGCCCIQ